MSDWVYRGEVRSGFIENVNALRLFSTYLLVIYHSRPALMSAGISDQVISALRAGTDLFLVCSAFLTIHSNEKNITAAEFIIKRAIRIIPLYWIVTIVVFALSALLPSFFQATHPNVGELIQSLLFIPYEKSNHAIQPMVFVAWTLNYIMFYSVIYALSIAVVGLRLAWLMTSMIIFGLILIGQWQDFDHPALRFYTNPVLADFIYGMILSQMYSRRNSLLRRPSFGQHEILLLLAAAALCSLAIILQPFYWTSIHRCLSLGVPSLMLIAIAMRSEVIGYKLSSNILKVLSRFTFSIYLSHFFCTGALGYFTKKFNPLTPEQLVLSLSTTLIAATLLGGVIYYFVERPITRVLRPKIRAKLVW